MTVSRVQSKVGGRRRKASSKKRRSMRGGVNAPNVGSYSDTSSWGMAVNGSGDSQYARTFDNTTPGPAVYSSVQGQKAGGKKGKKGKKGGFWGQIVNQAIVPFSIFGMQQTYRRKNGGGTKKKR